MSLEFEDIQSGVLRPRPSPYVATYIGLRIDDRKAGRDLMRRVRGVVNSAADATSRTGDAWVSLAITCEGLKALGVPQASIESLAPEFQRGMAARAAFLKDTGESSPEHWEKPLGTPDLHVILTALAPDQARLDALRAGLTEACRCPRSPVGRCRPCIAVARKIRPTTLALPSHTS
jgi:deferrochelatase/peroxidase EfeB